MGFNVIRYKQHEAIKWGIIKEQKIYPLPGDYPTLADFINRGLPNARISAKQPGGEPVNLDAIDILNPVTAPCHIICQGKNYREHRVETGSTPERPGFNLLFSKASSSIAPPKGRVVCPSHVKLLDYELELGLVISRDVKGPQEVRPDNLHEFVAGVVMANDISARDIQIPQGQWFKGKSFRTFCPAGPYLYILERSDLDRLLELHLILKVNGEIRQQANTGQLLFQPAETLKEVSEVMDLWAGDLILTGTPGGVALRIPSGIVQNLTALFLSERSRMKLFIQNQLKNPRYLRNGDIIESTIRSSDGIIDLGTQRLEVVKAG